MRACGVEYWMSDREPTFDKILKAMFRYVMLWMGHDGAAVILCPVHDLVWPQLLDRIHIQFRKRK